MADATDRVPDDHNYRSEAFAEQRYGARPPSCPKDRKVPDLQVLLAAKHVSGGDFLNWLRDLVGWSLPGVEILDTIYSKTTLTAWEMEEFMMTLDLCRKKANHPSTIADIKDLIKNQF